MMWLAGQLEHFFESLLANDAVVAAIIGALLGAFASHVVGAGFDRRKERRRARKSLLGELSQIVHAYIGGLMDLHASRMSDSHDDLGVEARRCLANVTRLDGRTLEFNLRLWQLFPERKVRASYAKLLNRFEKTKDLLLRLTCPSAREVDLAFGWIADRASKTTAYACSAAGVSLRDRRRILFVRFGRVTERDRFELSFDDEAPPWEFEIRFEFGRSHIDQALLRKSVEKITKKVGSVRCARHGQAAHIVAKGPGPESFSLEVSGCCKELIQEVMERVAAGKHTQIIRLDNGKFACSSERS